MYVNNDDSSHREYLKQYIKNGKKANNGGKEGVYKLVNDRRITKIGKFLRSTSLDEIPQLVNVLRGEMSLVGPRPERPVFVNEFREKIPKYMLRHKVKSGITGWAQVHGLRQDTPIDKRLEYDFYYIQNWSLGLDLKILWKTLRKGFIDRSL